MPEWARTVGVGGGIARTGAAEAQAARAFPAQSIHEGEKLSLRETTGEAKRAPGSCGRREVPAKPLGAWHRTSRGD